MESASIKTLIDIFPHQLRHYPQEDAIAAKKGPPADHEEGEWKQYSSLKCMDYINKVSKGLLAMGIKKGDKIAIISENRPEWVFVDNGMLQLGAINVPLYPTLSKEEYRYILNEAEVKMVFASNQTLFERVNAVKNEVKSLKHVMTFDEVSGAENWNTLLDHAGEKDLNEVVKMREKVSENELATIIYTSGTTGKPKGVMLTHKNIVSNVVNCEPLLPVNYHHRALSFLPLNHVFERMLTYLYLSSGVSVYHGDDLDKVGEYIRESKPHIFTSVPRMVEKVYERILEQGRKQTGIKKRIFFYALKVAENFELEGKSWWYKKQLQFCDKLVFSKWREALGGNTKAIVSGSAPLSPKLQRIFTAAGIPLLEGYGLTETSPVIAVNRLDPEHRKFGTVGPLIDECEVKIAEDGEILVKGPNIMQGYYKNQEETDKVFDEEGWFHTGDIGGFDGEFLMVKDRKDDMFKTAGGKFVAPQPIENKFKESLFIQQMIVIGQNRKFVSALIVPDFDHLKSWCKEKNIPFETEESVIENPKVQQKFQEIVDHYNQDFGHVQQVKKFKLLSRQFSKDEGEVTPTMKLKRPIIKEHFKREIEELYQSE